jgi:Tfp pilus assembly major pilin PilA
MLKKLIPIIISIILIAIFALLFNLSLPQFENYIAKSRTFEAATTGTEKFFNGLTPDEKNILKLIPCAADKGKCPPIANLQKKLNESFTGLPVSRVLVLTNRGVEIFSNRSIDAKYNKRMGRLFFFSLLNNFNDNFQYLLQIQYIARTMLDYINTNNINSLNLIESLTQFNAGYTFIDLNPAADFKIKQHRSITSTVDGFGQLILPFGAFDVLRLKRDISEIDSVYQTFFGAGTWFGTPPTQTIEYEWIGQNNKDVLLKIVVANANGSSQIRTIEYQDNYLGLDAGLNENELNATISPNPTNDGIQVNAASMLKKISLFDSKGALLYQTVGLNTTTTFVELNNYLPGMYVLVLEYEEGLKTIRVTKN